LCRVALLASEVALGTNCISLSQNSIVHVSLQRGERAERMEAALLDAAPRLKPPVAGGTWKAAEPALAFDVERFNAVRGHQAAQGREIGRCLK
jgi:hypothetical protein